VLPTGFFPIATVRFAGIGEGSTAIELSASATQPFASDQAQLITVNFLNAQATVSAVPEPAAWVMFALAAALLPVLRRRAG
jgi:MYXO-CTERM domain-containing protein